MADTPCWRCNPHGMEPADVHAEWCLDAPAVVTEMTFVADRLIVTDADVAKMECPNCHAVGQMLVLKSPRDAMAECSKCRWKITLDAKG